MSRKPPRSAQRHADRPSRSGVAMPAANAAATDDASPGRPLLWAAIIAVATLAVYWPSLAGDFVWDDQKMIPLNPLITQADGLVKIWSPWTTQADYWPLAYTTHWFEWRAWGTWTPGYRAANIALHIANAVLLWRILLQLNVPAAWWCGLLFALHPVNVEAVVWILQRKTTLSTLLFFIAVWCWLAHDRRPSRGRLAVAWGAFLLALLTKTSVVMLPVTLLILAWRNHGRVRRQDIWTTAPFFALALAMGLVGMYYQRYGAGANEEVRGDGLLSRVAIAGRAVWFYLSKAAWPQELCFVYPKWTVDTSQVDAFVPAVLVVALTVALAWLWNKRRGALLTGALAAWAYYLVNLFPALGFSNIYFMRYSLVADHWQYTALPGVLALACGTAGGWLRDHSGASRRLAAAPGVLVAALWGTGAFAYATVFSGSNELLWRDAIAKNPQAWLAEHNLALCLFERSEFAEALKHFQRAAAIEPNDAELNSNLAKALATQNELGEVIQRHRQAVKQAPQNPKYRAELAAALVGSYFAELDAVRRARLLERAGYDSCAALLADAQRLLEEVLRSAPNYPQAVNNLGLVHLARGDLEAAATAFRQALRLNPQSARAHGNLAGILARQGQPRAAAAEYDTALRLDPAATEFAAQLAWLLATHPDDSIRNGPRAIVLAESINQWAERHNRKYLEVLAAAYAEGGRGPEAVAAQKQALGMPALDAGCGEKPLSMGCSSEDRLALYDAQRPFRSPPETALLFW